MSRMIPTAYEMQLERVHAEEVTALKAQRDALLAALKELLVECPCPCCEARQSPHDEECTLMADSPDEFDELAYYWRRDAIARAAIKRAKSA